MSTQSLIAEGERGHRRGVVLGLTMAELMLLLLFCLLLVAASIVHEKDKQIAERDTQIKRQDEIVKILNNQKLADIEAAIRLVVAARAAGRPLNEIDQPTELTVKLQDEIDRLQQLSPNGQLPLPDENWTELVAGKELIDQLKSKGADLAVLVVTCH